MYISIISVLTTKMLNLHSILLVVCIIANISHTSFGQTVGTKKIFTSNGNPPASVSKNHTQARQLSASAFRLPQNYSKELRPSTDGGLSPTIIEINVHVQAINPIKAADMDFSYEPPYFRMDMTLTQRWTDGRLQFADEWFGNKDHLTLPIELTDQIWFSHPFVVNAKSAEVGKLTQNLVTVYVFKNFTVQYAINVFVTVACAMNYRYYPLDSQLCPMFLESSSFDESEVKYVWTKKDAFTINPKLRMLQFEPRRPLHFSEASVPRFNEERNFSQLVAYFRFDRLLGNHLIQTFAPCSLVVCLSWFSFWLELNALSARMSLLVTSILTLVTQFAGLKTDLPPVAYIKAVDIWMAGCMVWVFGALGEFVLVKVIFSLTEDAKFNYHEDYVEYQSKQTLRDADYSGLNLHQRNITNSSEPLERLPEVRSDSIGHLDANWHPKEVMNPTGSHKRRRSISLLKLKMHDKKDFDDSVSVATTSSASLDKNIWKFRLPLQWVDPKTDKQILLWKIIDNFSKWIFPLTFVIFCTIYWIVLYIHSLTYYESDNVISTNATSA